MSPYLPLIFKAGDGNFTKDELESRIREETNALNNANAEQEHRLARIVVFQRKLIQSQDRPPKPNSSKWDLSLVTLFALCAIGLAATVIVAWKQVPKAWALLKTIQLR